MNNNKVYYEPIDGLRAIAVLAVFIYHLKDSWLPGGFAGVDIFFVISGFVVTAANPFHNKKFFEFLSSFYAKRFTRIIPALALVILFASYFSVLFVPNEGEVASFAKVSFGSLFAHANLVLLKESTNYFSALAEYNPFTHTWSLSIEEQFYFFFPFIFLITSFFRKKNSTSIIIFLVLWFLSLLLSTVSSDKINSFYHLSTRFWEISLGVIAYQATQKSWSSNSTKMPDLALLGIVLISLFLTEPSRFPDLWLGLVTFGTARILFLIGQNRLSSKTSTLLSTPILRHIGRASYSIYLYHWPVIVLFKWTIGIEQVYARLLACILTFTLAYLSYFFIELPIQAYRRKYNVPHWLTIFIGLGILIGTYFATTYLYTNQKSLSLSHVVKDKTYWEQIQDYKNVECEVIVTPQQYYEVMISREGKCKDNNPQGRIYVLGDSHARSYESMLRKISFTYGYEIHLISISGCPVVTFYIDYSPECREAAVRFIQEIAREASPGDILFLPGLRLKRLSDRLHILDTKKHRKITPVIKSLSVEDALVLLKDVLDKKLNIIIENPKPLLKASPFRCADSFNRNNPHCFGLTVNRTHQLKYRENAVELFEKLSKRNALIKIWDPFPILCPENTSNTCSAWLDGKPLYLDSDHITSFGSLHLYDSFVDFIRNYGFATK